MPDSTNAHPPDSIEPKVPSVYLLDERYHSKGPFPFEAITPTGKAACVVAFDEHAATEIEGWLSELPIEYQTNATSILRLAEFLIRFSGRPAGA